MSLRAQGPEIIRLIERLAKLPGLGPRSARRMALHLLKKPDLLLKPLAEALGEAAEKISHCDVCGNFDTLSPCALCRAEGRDDRLLCIVEDVGDLWAMERSGAFKGRYHVLGGALSALDGIGPEDLTIGALLARVESQAFEEVILALNATSNGQTTAYYITDRLAQFDIKVTRLAHGLPIGGELDHLDDGTLMAALNSRKGL